MALFRPGSWQIGGVPLPEFGITEAIGGLLGAPRTPQGGSDISAVFQPQAQQPLVSPQLISAQNIPTSFPQPQPQLQPRPQPQLQPRPQPTGGGGGDLSASDLQSLFGFNDPNVINAILGSPSERARYVSEKNMRAQISSFTPQGPSQEELSSIYNPAFQSLEAQRSFQTGTSYPEALAGIQSQKQQLLRGLTSAEETAGQQFKSLTGLLGGEQESALLEARRAYQGLSQSARARFGAGTSAGPAAQEILGQEALRQEGKIRGNYANQLQGLMNHQANTIKYIVSQKTEIDAQTAALERQAQVQLKENLVKIDYNQNILESAKASARVEALNNARNQINQLQIARITSLINLDTWRTQQQFLIDKGLAQLQQQTPVVQAFQQQPFFGQPTQPQTSRPVQFIAGRREDELSGLTNPFA